MNQRIQELAEQAGMKHPVMGEVSYACFSHEKFAQLIVRECAGACLYDDWEDPRWGRFYANKIQEHFGVES